LAGDRRHPGIYPGPKNQKPAVLWFTGLSGAGKSTIANLVENKLGRMNRHTFLVDGDNVRHGLNKDLGFPDADRTTLSISLSSTKRPIEITQAVSVRAQARSISSLCRVYFSNDLINYGGKSSK